MKRSVVGSVLLMVAITAGCLSSNQRRRINEHLLCDDCSDGEMQEVVSIGFEAIARLGGALYGPPPHRDSIMRFKFGEQWSLIQSPSVSRQSFVDFHSDNYIAYYQERAARGLGAIGRSGSITCWLFRCTSRARSELHRAFARDSTSRDLGTPGFYRRDVLTVIRAELESLGGDPVLPIGAVNVIGLSGAITPPDTVRLEAQLLDLAGVVIPAPVPGIAIDWDSDNEAVATVADGLVTAVGAGTANITLQVVVGAATYTDTAPVVVTPL